MLTRRVFLLATMAAGFDPDTVGLAAEIYPSRTIKLIVPFPPGTASELISRIVADRLSSKFGHPIIVENWPGGAGGTVGAAAVASAEPDGYTLLVSPPGPLVTAGTLYKNLGYDPGSSFTPVAPLFTSPQLLAVHPSVPTQSIGELIVYCRSNPGRIAFASPGYGTQPHLLGDMFKATAGLDIVDVPYKGPAQAVTDLLAGQVQIYFESAPLILFACRRRQAQNDCGGRAGAHPPIAGCSHNDRKRVSQARGRLLGGCPRSKRHAEGHRRSAQCGDQRGHAVSGRAGHPGEARGRGDARFARGVRAIHCRGDAEVVRGHQGRGHQDRLTMAMDPAAIGAGRIVELGYSFRGAKILLSAVELGVFTALAEGPLACEELRKKIGIAERGARDFFDALVSLDLLARDGNGRYRNTPETEVSIDRRKPTYIGGDLEHVNERMYPHWHALTPALKTGKPQSGAGATNYFPGLYADQSVLETFARGMTGQPARRQGDRGEVSLA